MRKTRALNAFVAGFVLYVVATTYVSGGMLMAWPVPRGYFSLFSHQTRSPAMAPISLLMWGLPLALLVGLAFASVVLALGRSRRDLPFLVLAGMLAGFVGLAAFTGSSVFSGSFAWWGLPHILAPCAGAAAAILWSRNALRAGQSAGVNSTIASCRLAIESRETLGTRSR